MLVPSQPQDHLSLKRRRKRTDTWLHSISRNDAVVIGVAKNGGVDGDSGMLAYLPLTVPVAILHVSQTGPYGVSDGMGSAAAGSMCGGGLPIVMRHLTFGETCTRRHGLLTGTDWYTFRRTHRLFRRSECRK